MNYFVAYLIIQTTTVRGWFIALTVLFLVAILITWIVWLVKTTDNIGDKYSIDDINRAKKYAKHSIKLGIVTLLFLFISITIPSTKSVFKIIGLKTGYDVVTSESFVNLVETSGETANVFLKKLTNDWKDEIKKSTGIDINMNKPLESNN